MYLTFQMDCIQNLLVQHRTRKNIITKYRDQLGLSLLRRNLDTVFCQVLEWQRWFYLKLLSSIKSCFCRDVKTKISWVIFKCKMCPSVASATKLISRFWTKLYTLPKVKLYYQWKSQILFTIQKLRKISVWWSLKQPKGPISNLQAMLFNWNLAGVEGGNTLF